MTAAVCVQESETLNSYSIDVDYGGKFVPFGNFASDSADLADVDADESDAVLVRAAKTNSMAFGFLYARYSRAIYHYAYRRMGNHHDAEDVTSQTFCLAWANFDRYEWRGVPFVVWLYRIASNAAVDLLRKRKQTTPMEEALEIPDGAPSLLEQMENDERKNLLEAAIQSLPPYQRRAIALRLGYELSNAEIAAHMGRTEAAVKQLIHRGIVSLRQRVSISARVDNGTELVFSEQLRPKEQGGNREP